jgi:hypothetical protein
VFIRKNWAVLVAVAIMYVAFAALMLLTRVQKARESYAYIR